MAERCTQRGDDTAVSPPLPLSNPSWLVSWLLPARPKLIRRFAYFYERLQNWPRRLRQRLAVSLAAAALLLALSSTPSLHAAEISITPAAAGVNAGDGCSLVEAIENANADAQTHAECPAGNGADTITLAGSSYAYTTAYGNYSGSYDAALPNITSDITIQGNGATIQGPGDGSMRVLTVTSSGNLTLNDATISGGGDAGDVNAFLVGGGIANYGTLTVNRSIISGNGAAYGGGIYNRDGIVTVQDSVISGNAGQYGGGMETYASAGGGTAVTVVNSTIQNNTAANGGGIYSWNGDVTLHKSTISGNSAAEWGGGIFNYSVYNGNGRITLSNSTISGNTANRGGGVYNYGTDYGTAEITLYNSTVSGNTANLGGGGLENNGRYNGSATITLHRTIVSGNTAPSGPNVYQDSATLQAADYNLLGENGSDGIAGGTLNTDSTDVVSGGPVSSILDTTLAQNGINPHPYTHALVGGSPAIDAAPSAACTAAPVNNIDQRGAERNVDGNSTASGSECDIGAFEYGSTQTPTAVTLQATHTQSGGAAPAATATGLLTLLSAAWLLWKQRKQRAKFVR